MKPFYITTTLPYVNAEPHIGFAMEMVRADIIARYKAVQGFDVFFNTGTDEHGLKIFEAAKAKGVDTQKYVDELSARYKDLHKVLGLSDVHFIRTTDQAHKEAAQEFWKRCDKAGYIYKKNYSVKYCVGCELEKTESELENGRCSIHPNREIELIQEENYFFKFSAFQKPLLEMYAKNPTFVVPDFRFNEIRAFVERGLEDFSISRLKSKMPWGVSVPGDDTQVMYVWFDALVSYISTLGWPKNEGNFKKYWAEAENVVQYCGKDNLRQQAAMWQAMLMAVGLPNSRQIIVNGFITGEGGVKMSKSLGNTVNPFDVVAEYGTDALRYYLARELGPFEDSPFTMEKFKEAYNAKLANGLGNLVSRVMKMAVNVGAKTPILNSREEVAWGFFPEEFAVASSGHNAYYDSFEINKAVDDVWKRIAIVDKMIQDNQPFKLIKSDPKEAKKQIGLLLNNLYCIGILLRLVMPETSKKICECIYENKMPEQPLFARKD